MGHGVGGLDDKFDCGEFEALRGEFVSEHDEGVLWTEGTGGYICKFFLWVEGG